jgi:hypothetical protein
MNRFLRSVVLPSLAVLGALVAVPSIAHADEAFHGRPANVAVDREHARVEHDRIERERAERERVERERVERVRVEREHQHDRVCAQASESGASGSRLREMGCWVR